MSGKKNQHCRLSSSSAIFLITFPYPCIFCHSTVDKATGDRAGSQGLVSWSNKSKLQSSIIVHCPCTQWDNKSPPQSLCLKISPVIKELNLLYCEKVTIMFKSPLSAFHLTSTLPDNSPGVCSVLVNAFIFLLLIFSNYLFDLFIFAKNNKQSGVF